VIIKPTKDDDPRVIRTRNLIIDAFTSLCKEKNFNSITVRDISERATVNRATFYAHFEDKYALLEIIISTAFMTFVSKRAQSHAELTKENMQALILAVLDYHNNLKNGCKRNFQSISIIVEANVQSQLKNIIATMLENSTIFAHKDKNSSDLTATIISSAIYGATYHWATEEHLTTNSIFLEKILTFIMAGLQAIPRK